MSRSIWTDRRSAARAAAALLAAALAGGCAQAGPPGGDGTSVPLGSGGRGQLQLQTLQQRRFQGTVPQLHDFSCGAAAVATLLAHHYGQPRSEQEVFAWMFERGDQEKIRRVGFSLLDMKNYLREAGYEADGYRIDLAQLEKAGMPAIALLDLEGYRHFVVIKGMDAETVWVGDPASGTKGYPRGRFEAIRDPILLVVRNHARTAQRSFARSALDVPGQAAPLGMALRREGLASGRLGLLRGNSF